jgi:hypothetical protein
VTNYAALDRHIEVLKGPRHLVWKEPIGTMFLSGGVGDGQALDAHRYPAAEILQVPVGDDVWGYFWRMESYRLKTFIWGDDGYEAWYDWEERQ